MRLKLNRKQELSALNPGKSSIFNKNNLYPAIYYLSKKCHHSKSIISFLRNGNTIKKPNLSRVKNLCCFVNTLFKYETLRILEIFRIIMNFHCVYLKMKYGYQKRSYSLIRNILITHLNVLMSNNINIF
jgi:hypothetical protein